MLLLSPYAHAGPEGGQVVSGSGSISASGATTTINQASDKLSINWQSFNVGKTESVNFVQPSASALAVNRIFDTQGSQILGRINANGQVWLINPNGVLFGKDAQINVGGLLASTLVGGLLVVLGRQRGWCLADRAGAHTPTINPAGPPDAPPGPEPTAPATARPTIATSSTVST